MKARVLVTDGTERSALAVVRSLGKAGCRVIVASERSKSLAGASRHSAGEHVVPSPLSAPSEFVDAIVDLAGREQIDVLLPMTDASNLALLAARDRFPDVCLPAPNLDAFRRISDKVSVAEAASNLGLELPRQRVLRTPDGASQYVDHELRFPIVVKPARSVTDGGRGREKLGVRYAKNPDELTRVIDALPSHAYPLLLQERIVGPGIGVFLLIWKGEVLAVFGHRRLREKPPSGGVSVYRESVTVDARLVDLSCDLLGQHDWLGVAMVEYKIEASSGIPYVMEVNGRFWGSLQLAIDAGVNFPVLLVQAALGDEPPQARTYRVGLRCRWLWGDVSHLLLRLRRSAAELALPPDAPSKWRVLLDFALVWRPGDRYEVLRLSDLRPFLRETLDWLRLARRYLRRRLRA